MVEKTKVAKVEPFVVGEEWSARLRVIYYTVRGELSVGEEVRNIIFWP